MAKQNSRTQKITNTKRGRRTNIRNPNGIRSKKVIKRQEVSKIQDARQTIMQKKRTSVVDARDILAKMAKSQDARSKLDKIRTGKNGPSPNGNVKVIGNSILRKTDRNGKISLVTNKTKKKSEMNVAIQKQLGLIQTKRSPLRKSAAKRNTSGNSVARTVIPIRKTILNTMEYSTPSVDPTTEYESGLYNWTRPEMKVTASQMINSLEHTRQAMREALREELASANFSYVAHKPVRIQPSGYVDLDAVVDEEMPMVHSPRGSMTLQGTSRISNVHSRLDNFPHQATPKSHGIFAHNQTKTKVVVPAGHRIVVSNLQTSVTQDDIKELFEDIGQLLTAKLVRSGVAEVIYKNLKDAQKAVDTYHNRQLDGQPMKCLLVNKRPLNQPTGPALSKTTDGILVKKSPAASSGLNEKLVPDINTIHKVLFQRK